MARPEVEYLIRHTGGGILNTARPEVEYLIRHVRRWNT